MLKKVIQQGPIGLSCEAGGSLPESCVPGQEPMGRGRKGRVTLSLSFASCLWLRNDGPRVLEPLFPVLEHGFMENGPCGAKKKNGDGGADENVGPQGMKECHASCGEHYSGVGDNVVARAQPRGAHIQIVGTVPEEQEEADPVGQQHEKADGSHGSRRSDGVGGPPENGGERL